MSLVRLPAGHDTAVVREQSRVCRIVAGDTGKAVQHFHDAKRVTHEIEELGGKEVDDLGLDVAAARI